MGTTLAAARKNPQIDALSEGQQNYLKDLLAQIGAIQPGKQRELVAQLNSEYLAHTLTGTRASKWIDSLKAIRDDLRSRQRELEAQLRQQEQGGISARRPSQPRPQVPAGRYAVDTEEGHLGFYRVEVNEQGRYQVFVYASDRQHRIQGWNSQSTILRKIEMAGVDAAGMRFADERGECRDCGRALTDQESRKAGRGPICRNR